MAQMTREMTRLKTTPTTSGRRRTGLRQKTTEHRQDGYEVEEDAPKKYRKTLFVLPRFMAV